MSTKTTNYELIKPELTDAADITAMNENWDKLDQHSHESFDHDVSLGGNRITDVGEPVSRTDVATKGFVEDFSIEGSTYVAVDENHDGNIILRPYVPDVDDFAIESTEHSGCYYRTVDGVKEWVNPPMMLNVEYRTAERHNGKPVYTKLIDVGNLPNNAQLAFQHNIANINSVLKCMGTISTGSQIPFKAMEWTDGGGTSVREINLQTTLYAVYIYTNYDCSTYTANVQIWYTKN